MDDNSGYIRLSRKYFKHSIWKTARTFNDSEAWLDLIQSARFEATEITSRVGVCYTVTWGRGQYPASVRFLAKKWGWSERQVRQFLTMLKKSGMITIDSSQSVSVITLTNYEQYNPLPGQNNEFVEPYVPYPTGDTPNVQFNSALGKKPTHPRHANDTPNLLFDSGLSPKAAHEWHTDEKKRHTSDTNIKEREINILSITSSSCAQEKELDMIIAELRQSQIWIDEMCKKFGKSPAELSELLSRFSSECVCTGEEPPTVKDAKRHFFYWLNRQNRQQNTSTNETQRQDRFSERRGIDPSANRAEDYTATL